LSRWLRITRAEQEQSTAYDRPHRVDSHQAAAFISDPAGGQEHNPRAIEPGAWAVVALNH